MGRLRDVTEAATAGKWVVPTWDRSLVLPEPWTEEGLAPEDRGQFFIISAASDDREENAAFIAAAREAMPVLLDVYEAARGYRDALWADEFCCQECADAGKEPSPEWARLDAAVAAVERLDRSE